MNKSKQWEITLKDSIATLFRQKKLIIITFFIVMLTTFVGLKLNTPMYEAHVKMLIRGRSQVSALSYQAISPFRIHMTQAEIVKSSPVMTRAIKALNFDKRPLDYEKNFSSRIKWPLIDSMSERIKNELGGMREEEKEKVRMFEAMKFLKNNVNTFLIPHTDIFIISVTDYSAESAIALANVISRSYAIFDLEQQLAELALRYGKLHPSVIQLKDNITNMTRSLHGDPVPTIEAIGTASVKVIEQASSEYSPIGKSKVIIMIMALLMSGFLGIALAFIFNFFDNTLKTPHDIVNKFNIPVIGSIPKKKFREKPFISKSQSNSQYVKFTEDLAEQLYVFMKTQLVKSVIIASTVDSDSNSYIVPNICYCLANKLGYKTLMIDGNLKNPVMGTILGIEKNPGLTNILDGGDPGEYIKEMETNLSVLPTKKISLKSADLREKLKNSNFLEKVKNNYELIIIDCTRIININDVDLFSDLADGVVLVFNEGKGRQQVLMNKVSPLKNRTKIIGGILNNRTYPIPKIIYNRL